MSYESPVTTLDDQTPALTSNQAANHVAGLADGGTHDASVAAGAAGSAAGSAR